MDRFGPYAVVAGLFALSAVSVVLMAKILVAPVAWLTIAVSLFVGFCLSGGQKANNALSVYFYPTALRGTGIGWSLGIGRIGGVLGPFVAGVLLTIGWSPSDLFYLASIPMVLGLLAIAGMGLFYFTRSPDCERSENTPAMNRAHLIADVGGTNARFALIESGEFTRVEIISGCRLRPD